MWRPTGVVGLESLDCVAGNADIAMLRIPHTFDEIDVFHGNGRMGIGIGCLQTQPLNARGPGGEGRSPFGRLV